MNKENLISVYQFCNHHQIEYSFLLNLNDQDLIKIYILEGKPYLDKATIKNLEELISRFKTILSELKGTNIITELFCQIERLKTELAQTKLRLNELETVYSLNEEIF